MGRVLFRKRLRRLLQFVCALTHRDSNPGYNIKHMILRSVLTLLLVILACSAQEAEYQQVAISNYIVYPQVVREKVPPKSFSKLVFESFTTLNYEVNFQLASYLYMREGALPGNDAYSPQKYSGFESKCRVYKTDLKSRQYRESSLKSRPKDLVIVNSNGTETSVVATIYTLHEGHEISVVDIKIQNEFKNVGANYPYWGAVPFFFNERGSFVANLQNTSESRFLNIDQDLFLLSDSAFYRLKTDVNLAKSQLVKMEGYVATSGLIKAEKIQDDAKTGRKRFFTLGAEDINMYEVVSEKEINLAMQVRNFSRDSKLLAGVQDRGYYYVTALNTLFIIDTTNQSNIRIKYAELNGTCEQMEKFQTTLHLSCTYNKINYIAELFVLGFDVRINRYFGGEDIQGRAVARRVGMGKMAILTDNEIKITGYGINKNVLLEYGNPQPEFTFGIKYGWDLASLKIGTNNFYTTMVIFMTNKIALLQIEQVPPELSCEFPQDKVGTDYQILLQFNTTRCSYIKNEQDLFYGNMETVCEISIPIVLASKQVQMESKHTNIIMVIIAMLILGVVLLIIAVAIKYNRSLEYRFEKMQKQLERARKGYGKNKVVDL